MYHVLFDLEVNLPLQCSLLWSDSVHHMPLWPESPQLLKEPLHHNTVHQYNQATMQRQKTPDNWQKEYSSIFTLAMSSDSHNLRKKLTFHDSTTGFPEKQHLSNK